MGSDRDKGKGKPDWKVIEVWDRGLRIRMGSKLFRHQAESIRDTLQKRVEPRNTFHYEIEREGEGPGAL